ncbi:MAG: GNAT family N-acetyltransferase [Bacillota bacterium]|nr:GNAT family N-acetyltransferase [Bacillota bacterium]MDI9415427.1 GNAT family N-acetyltransferase [Bacillota bacterium]NLD13054.1 GNAT family N-acetyltransferase [Bacillota bacterium]HCD41895.1 hypothetical protein [Bacillota bacterium]HOB88164.1 GNAT family N-acetyltransferase [Bacillota bacterium]
MIKGKKTLLRPLDIADVTDICQDEYLSQVNARTTRMFAIEADDNVLIGDIGLVEINWRRKEAELVVRIGHPEYIGKGYGYDAISSLLDYVFSTTRLDRIYLRVLADNLRAVKCFEKCGFRKNWVMARRISHEGSPKRLFLMAIERDMQQRETRGNRTS